MLIRSVLIPFAAGVVVGVVVARNWDRIREAAEPVARRVVRRSGEAAGRGREVFWDARERVEDRVAEWRERRAPAQA